MAKYGAWWSNREGPVPWTESALALAITSGVFATAFIAMTTVRNRDERAGRETATPSRIVRLPSPAPAPVQRRREPVRQEPRPPTRVVEPPAERVNPVAPPVTAPAAPRDTAAAAVAPTAPTLPAPTTSPSLPAIPSLRQIGPFEQRNDRTAIGSMGPAGAAVRRQALTAAQRDSFAVGALAPIPKEALSRKPTQDEINAVRAQREPGLDPHGRAARLPGEAVYAPTMGGNVAVAVPVISMAVGGKSERDRKRDAAIDADNQLRLRRLQDRVALRRDSIRADSLRRDSIARISRRP